MLVGALLGIVFGASSLYLVLKVGMTVSASIPVAVLSITLFRVFSKLRFIRRATILENNIVQTAGSAGESIAFGVGVTMPALMLLGFEMDVGRVMVVSVLGGLLGILMMIPLRRAFIVKQHGTAQVSRRHRLRRRAHRRRKGRRQRRDRLRRLRHRLRLPVPAARAQALAGNRQLIPLSWFKGATAAVEVNPALLGVGYIIGTRDFVRHGGRRRSGFASCSSRPSACSAMDSKNPLYPGDEAHQQDERRGNPLKITSSTSVPARWRRAASSACFRLCR